MKPEIFLTGASGFVGKHLLHALNDKYVFVKYQREKVPVIQSEVVIHLAGIAHDLKHTKDEEAYFDINVGLTKLVFDAFLTSEQAKTFIFFSSVKAVADTVKEALTEDVEPKPTTAYGRSKLEAESYLLAQPLPTGKRLFILRPALIHGSGIKGNLELLQKFVRKGLPWPLAAFENKRSYCSIQNLTYVLNALISREEILSGVYNVVDDESISTNELIRIIAKSEGMKVRLWFVPKKIINSLAKLGDFLHLPINSERLKKLTESYEVTNLKLINALGARLPYDAEEALSMNLKNR